MLDIAGRHPDGWWPAGDWTPEHYAEMLSAVRTSAERAGRDPMAITPGFMQICLIGADDNALAEIVRAPLVKAFLLQVSATTLRGFGFEHPMGENWRGFQDIDPRCPPANGSWLSSTTCAPRCCWPACQNPRLQRHGRAGLRRVLGRRIFVPQKTNCYDCAETCRDLPARRRRVAARRRSRNRIGRLRRPDLAGTLRRGRRPPERPGHGRRRRPRRRAGMPVVADVAAGVHRGPQPLPDRRRDDRGAQPTQTPNAATPPPTCTGSWRPTKR